MGNMTETTETKDRPRRHYLCTRNAPYDNTGCTGHRMTSSRQGHYLFAESPLGAAVQMFMSWPDEAFHGFTVMDTENESTMWLWSMGDGLRQANPLPPAADPEGTGGIGGLLAEMFYQATGDLEETEIERARAQLEKFRIEREHGVPDPYKITVSTHHHRHGIDVLLHKAKDRAITEQEVIDLLGDEFESDREDEYVEIRGTTTLKEIEEVE